ncbi:anti-sigma factor [Streptomyces sp. NPDC046881]|uniref:anti-sigma factor family protein n=1 Tax=Streptomyces sp. NPDC046881 TaxID=3155374 RepID=UPI0033C389E3
MSTEHDDLRLALGAYVLGALPPEEAEPVRAHLAHCAECQAEHARLAGLPALLATVTLAEVSGPAVPTADGNLADRLVARAGETVRGPSPEESAAPAAPAVPVTPRTREGGVLERLLQQAANRRRRTRRLQLAGAAASVVLTAAAAGGAWLAAVGTVGTVAEPPGPSATAFTRTFSGSDSATGVTASVRVSPSVWGSVLQVSARGAPAGTTCRLQAVGPDGARADGATWWAGKYPSGTRIPGTVAMAPEAIQHFEIIADNGQKLVTMRA